MTSGGCEILHADCIEVLQTLAENSFDALITDPPYSSGGQYRGDRMQSVTEKYSQSGAKAEYLKHAFEGDNMDQRAWTSWTAYWLELCRKVVKPGGVAAIFIDWRQRSDPVGQEERQTAAAPSEAAMRVHRVGV